MFGASGMKAIAPLLDAVKDKSGSVTTSWDAFSSSMDKAAGTTQRATQTLSSQANEMQQNIGSKIEQVGGNRNRNARSSWLLLGRWRLKHAR